MASLKQRHNKWEARVRVPKPLRDAYGGKELLYRTLAATDRRAAKAEAGAWEIGLRAEWELRLHGTTHTAAELRATYEGLKALAGAGEYGEVLGPDGEDAVAVGIDLELERMADQIGNRDLSRAEAAKVWALNDAQRERRGLRAQPRRELELMFRELADEHLRLWRIAPGRKETNTEQQKAATFDLFARYWGDKPIRGVGRPDASAFVDALRQLDPNWARTGSKTKRAQLLSWPALMREFGGRESGLSDATVNRHMATLAALWSWAEERGHCDGRNPFQGHRRKLTNGRNKQSYVAWSEDELRQLFNPLPKRADLTEVMLVALYTGMRLNEIAALTCDRIKEEDGVPFIDVDDAKTLAGIRKVPIHPRLSWLVARARGGEGAARMWPKFVPEGPGGKPGGDAGKLFTAHKQKLGFTDRAKVFHSFRKNVVGQLERARVPQNEVAQLVGHEKQGLTFGVYGQQMSLGRLAEIVALIKYPSANLPEVA